jgi:chemotaxis response regulator CheB
VEQSVRVAIISDSESQRTNLQQLLEGNGMVVATSKHFEEGCLHNFEQHNANVLLLDLDDNNDYELDFLDEILNSSLPVLFNENSSTRSYATDGDSVWAHKLVGKLAAMAQVVIDSQAAAAEEKAAEEPVPEAAIQTEPEPAPPVTNSVYRVVEGLIPTKDESEVVDPAAVVVEQPARRVWVLGASLGGPQSIKLFLSNLPAKIPVAFVIAQHIGAGFVKLFAKQLDRATPLKVMAAEEGHILRHGEVVVTPVYKRVVIDRNGCIELRDIDPESIYTPSIDDVMVDTAFRYGANSGAIIFSGMGSDGMLGSRMTQSKGGAVWTQSSESCVISSMPDAVRRMNISDFSGSPVQLAAQLVSQWSKWMF